MNRRDFVSRVALGGAAAACTGLGKSVQAAGANEVSVRFVGMMTFLERVDRSFLVATPGQHALHHMMHAPFLMARTGSPIAKAFDMRPAAGVVPAAFDTSLIGTSPVTSSTVISPTRRWTLRPARRPRSPTAPMKWR